MRLGLAVFLVLALAIAAAISAPAATQAAARRDLGVEVRDLDEETAVDLGLDAAQGALVLVVTPGSAGAEADIRADDVMLSVAGRPLERANELSAAVASADVSRWVPIEVWRSDRMVTLFAFLDAGTPPAVRPTPIVKGGSGTESGEEAGEEGKADSKAPKKPKLAVSGYIQFHALHSPDSNNDGVTTPDRFRVQRARISFKGRINKLVSYDLMIDPRSPSITGLMRDAFIGLHFIPRHEVRLGQQKTQFGYENVESSTRLYSVNRTEVSDNLSRGPNLRDIGIGLIGKVPLGKRFRFEDGITLVNGAGINPAGPDDNNDHKNLWGRLGARYKTKELTAWLGVSGATGDQFDEGDPNNPLDDFTFKFKRRGIDLEVDHKLFFLAAEYVGGRDEVSGAVTRSHGYYVTGVYKTPWRVGPLVRYDILDQDFRRWTYGGFFGLPSEDLRVLLNYEVHQVEDGARGDDRIYLWVQVRFHG